MHMAAAAGPRRLLAGLVVLTVLGTGAVAVAAPAARPAGLRLVARASGPVVLERPPGTLVWPDFGTLVVAGRAPLEVWVRRAGYDQPIVADQLLGSGPSRHRVRLPAGTVSDLTSFAAFTHVTVTDPAGAVVAEQDEPFCPAGAPVYSTTRASDAVRVDPWAPASSPYPKGCPLVPFALGGVWGLQAGWGAPSTNPWYAQPVDLADGAYTAVVEINQPYRDLFDVPAGQATATVAFSVRTTPGGAAGAARPGGVLPGRVVAGRGIAGQPADGLVRPGGQAGPGGQPAAAGQDPGVSPPGAGQSPARPGAAGSPAAAGGAQPADPGAGAGAGADGRTGRWLPDLRPLPAWSVWLDGSGPRELLEFAATVWNAGTSPLVVQGTRRAGTELMDATQRFSDPSGREVGSAPAGTFEWDPRPGHEHWHFTDFAAYRLLDQSGHAVASQKQAFCLSNQDNIDTTIPLAAWQPVYGFNAVCGQADAQTLEQRLDLGWGDTYVQDLPGQAIDVTGLPNGTYQLEITANPNGRLHESDTSNNAVRREVVLVGDPGQRFALVPPYQGIDA